MVVEKAPFEGVRPFYRLLRGLLPLHFGRPPSGHPILERFSDEGRARLSEDHFGRGVHDGYTGRGQRLVLLLVCILSSNTW